MRLRSCSIIAALDSPTASPPSPTHSLAILEHMFDTVCRTRLTSAVGGLSRLLRGGLAVVLSRFEPDVQVGSITTRRLPQDCREILIFRLGQIAGPAAAELALVR